MNTETVELIQKAAERIEAVEAEQTALKAEVARQVQNLTAAFIEGAQKSPGGVPAAPAPKLATAIKSAVSSDAVRRFAAGESITSGKVAVAVALKSILTSLQNSPLTEPAGVDITRQDLGMQLQVRRQTRVFESLPTVQATSNRIGFNRLSFAGGPTQNDADYQGVEGAEKAEQSMVAEWIEAPIVTVAAHSTFSTQVLSDAPQLERAVDALLRYSLLDFVDRQILNGPGGAQEMDGLLTQAPAFAVSSSDPTPPVDRIGAAAAALSALGYAPNVVYLSHADWFKFMSERTQDGEYIGGGWANPNAPTIYGLTAIPTASIADGTALVLDTGVAQLAVRETPTVEFSREHNGNFTKNLVTVLVEARMGLLVNDPNGMRTVDVS